MWYPHTDLTHLEDVTYLVITQFRLTDLNPTYCFTYTLIWSSCVGFHFFVPCRIRNFRHTWGIRCSQGAGCRLANSMYIDVLVSCSIGCLSGLKVWRVSYLYPEWLISDGIHLRILFWSYPRKLHADGGTSTYRVYLHVAPMLSGFGFPSDAAKYWSTHLCQIILSKGDQMVLRSRPC
jgi:hypothetical protein